MICFQFIFIYLLRSRSVPLYYNFLDNFQAGPSHISGKSQAYPLDISGAAYLREIPCTSQKPPCMLQHPRCKPMPSMPLPRQFLNTS